MKNLEPKIVWNYFYDITQIPRPSKKEEKMREYLINFANERNFSTKQDEAGNILIIKDATSGFENEKTIILQAHMDMVCEKNSDVDFDFEKDPIQAYVEDGWVKAKGTTLGADNGIGMALMLAVLASDDLQHPKLECLFTVDEETGLTGAFALSEDLLTGEVLINLDSEDDGEIFVGCAGGIDTKAYYNYKTEKTPKDYFAFSIKVSGLKGGHSGDDINKNHANANKLLTRILWAIQQKMDLRLVEFNGGNLHNAIPREAQALACVPYDMKESVRVIFNNIVSDLEIEFMAVETKMQVELQSQEKPEETFTSQDTYRFLAALYACPHGVKKMSQDIPGLVETSTNLASVKMKDGNQVLISTSQRSSVESEKYDIAYQVEAALKLADSVVTHGDGYPGWNPNMDSEILKVSENSYKKLFKEDPKVKAIHAGLECGLFLKKYPNLDMISIGPTMRGVHSPDEKLEIYTVEKSWNWLVDMLATKSNK